MATYLDIVRRFVSEVGVAGGTGPETLPAQGTGTDRVAQYVADAQEYLCDLWPNWDFLWKREEAQTTQVMVDDEVLVLPKPDPAPVEYRVDSFRVGKGGDRWQPARFIPWHQFEPRFRFSVQRPSTTPAFWSHTPDRVIELSSPVGGIYPYRYEYYFKPPRLEAPDDEIIIPFPRLVLVRAKIIYAERENAPEVMAGSVSEYEDLMQRLESRYLPGVAGGHSTEDMAVGDEP